MNTRRKPQKRYYVYIMTNRKGTLYAGMSNNLARRVFEHQQGIGSRFTSKYKIDRLIYYEVYTDVRDAIAREKEIKGWRREKKEALIATMNPEWKDLTQEW